MARPPKSWTIAACACFLCVGRDSVREWIDNGELRAINLDGRIRILPRDLDAFLDARRVRVRGTSVRRQSGREWF